MKDFTLMEAEKYLKETISPEHLYITHLVIGWLPIFSMHHPKKDLILIGKLSKFIPAKYDSHGNGHGPEVVLQMLHDLPCLLRSIKSKTKHLRKKWTAYIEFYSWPDLNASAGLVYMSACIHKGMNSKDIRRDLKIHGGF
jgi:hypothetical protein